MPVNKYFKGDGEQVMASMQKRYGAKKGESVFYATANKDKQKPGQKAKPFQHKRKKKGKKGLLAREKAREKALEAARGGPNGGPKSPQEAALEKKLGVKE